jgi:hypothetical protein
MKELKFIKSFYAITIFNVVWITVFCSVQLTSAQELRVKRVPVSTRLYDEISPVFYKNGIVFCSNRPGNSIAGYSNGDEGLYKIFYSELNFQSGWSSPVLFSKEMTTSFNEGPVTFSKQGTVIYFTRNNEINNSFSNITDSTNKLGIYTAELIDGRWQNIRPFAFNDPLYVFATPFLTADDQRLYFASDMPGGFGGMDIYYCDKCGDEWCKPVNAGPVVNTSGNESYPCADASGKMYFASDGHPGLGGKDIFISFENNGEWIQPVPADSLINSPADDFGIVIDSTGLRGYFSSNRMLTNDIFNFIILIPEFTRCDTFSEPVYCFTLYDEHYVPNDTLVLNYRWDFGDGIIKSGPQVGHCFPGPGEYTVKLDITDDITGDTIAWNVEYNVLLEPPAQLFLNSPNVGLVGKDIFFDTYGSVLRGAEISDYSWDFGEGFIPGISSAKKKFKQEGKYFIKAGIKSVEPVNRHCVLKELRIIESYNEIFRKESGNSCGIRILTTSDLSSSKISNIKNGLPNQISMQFDKYGIHPDSKMLLENTASLLINVPEIHLEIQIHSGGNEISQKESREISFFFKNHGVDIKKYGIRVVAANQLLSGLPDKTSDETFEFIFMKK